jgi:hypothetical protein
MVDFFIRKSYFDKITNQILNPYGFIYVYRKRGIEIANLVMIMLSVKRQ